MKKWIGFGIVAAVLVGSINVSAANSKANTANQKPTAEMMHKGKLEYTRYCAACHAKDGTGRDGPALKGSIIATGPIGGTIHMVITGGPHHRMPMWGITELSDETLADILTYVRNSWGNDDKKANGKHAGGIVTPKQVKTYREALPTKNSGKNIRT